eukprot:6899609-Prorocentrum_lima.AAC.1
MFLVTPRVAAQRSVGAFAYLVGQHFFLLRDFRILAFIDGGFEGPLSQIRGARKGTLLLRPLTGLCDPSCSLGC